MQTLMDNARGLSVLAHLHKDKVLHLGAVGGALLAGAWLVGLTLP